jgi:hypothetical protein
MTKQRWLLPTLDCLTSAAVCGLLAAATMDSDGCAQVRSFVAVMLEMQAAAASPCCVCILQQPAFAV